MKKLLFVCVILLLAGSASAQKDVINLKDGTVIKCKIVAVDMASNSIRYLDKHFLKETSIDLSLVGSYIMDGEVNKGITYETEQDTVKKSGAEPVVVMPYNSANNEIGMHFMKFADQAQTGLLMTMVGTVITIVPWAMTNDNANDAEDFAKKQQTVAFIGMGISMIGIIVHLSSFSQARKAGEIMQIKDGLSLSITDGGLGLVIPINH